MQQSSLVKIRYLSKRAWFGTSLYFVHLTYSNAITKVIKMKFKTKIF